MISRNTAWRLMIMASLSIVLNQYCIAQSDTEMASEEIASEQEVVTPKPVESYEELVLGRESIEPPKSILTTIGTWVIVFAVFGTSAIYMYKKGFFTKNIAGLNQKNLKVIETAALGSRQFLVMARVRDQEILLGVGPGFITKLESVNKERGVEPSPNFEEELSGQNDRGGIT